jgi:CHASE1-domain containing sensor protein
MFAILYEVIVNKLLTEKRSRFFPVDRFTTFRPKISLLSLISIAVLLVITAFSVALSTVASRAVQDKAAEQFDWNTRQISAQVKDGLNDNNTVLYMARSFMLNSQQVTASEWSGFFRNQDVFQQFPGINSVNYIQLVPNAEKDSFVAAKRKDASFGGNYAVTPSGVRDVYGLGVLTVSKNNLPLTGFDVYSTADRRITYQNSLATGQPTASPQIQFNSGTPGIFLALPVELAGDRSTFINLSLYTKDFFDATITPDTQGTVALSVSDVTDRDKPVTMYSTSNWESSGYTLTKSERMNVGGRTWQINYRSQLPYVQQMAARYLPYLILVCGIMLCVVVLLVLYVMFRTIPKSHRSRPAPVSTKE